MFTTITPTDHDRAEWHRLAADAYRLGRNFYGHRFSVASAAYTGPMRTDVFDTLQTIYRRWLMWGWAGVDAGTPAVGG